MKNISQLQPLPAPMPGDKYVIVHVAAGTNQLNTFKEEHMEDLDTIMLLVGGLQSVLLRIQQERQKEAGGNGGSRIVPPWTGFTRG